MTQKQNISELINTITTHEEVGKHLLVLYGQINQDVIISAVKLTERKLILEKVPHNVITKTKMVCTEILQNILKHQTKHESLQPNFVVRLTDSGLSITSCNIISEESKNFISEKLEKYSKIEKEDFREYYIEAFRSSTISNTGNAGLGLLDIVYRSKQNVKYKMENLSNNLFSFNLNVTIPQPLLLAN